MTEEGRWLEGLDYHTERSEREVDDLCREANMKVALMLDRVRKAGLLPVSVTMPQRHYDALVRYAEREKVHDPDMVTIPTAPRFMGLLLRIGYSFEIGVTA